MVYFWIEILVYFWDEINTGFIPFVTALLMIAVFSSSYNSSSRFLSAIISSISEVLRSRKLAMAVCSVYGGIHKGIFAIILFINFGLISNLT